jgi:hypothetical protein
VITVSATDAAGEEYFTALPITVVRPLQLFHDGQRHLAEYYEPEVVHGPIIGGIFSGLSYTESHSETRQKGVSINVSTSVNNGSIDTTTLHEGVTVTDSTSEQTATTIGESFTETDAETYGTTYSTGTSNTVSTETGTEWESSLEITEEDYTEEWDSKVNTTKFDGNFGLGGGGTIVENIPILGSIATKWGVDLGFTRTKETGEKNGHKSSEKRGESYKETESVTYGSTTTEETSETFSGTYSTATQNSINNTTSVVEGTSESVTYNMGTTSAESVVIGNTEAYTDSFITTESDAQLLSFSTSVPRGACAVVYRQTVRWMRSAYLFSHDACGVKNLVAEVNFTDWSWSPNFAFAESCEEELAPSTLPEAECFLGCN